MIVGGGCPLSLGGVGASSPSSSLSLAGWERSDFGAFHEKSNAPLLDYAEARVWGGDGFKAALTRLVPHDTRLYEFARTLCRGQLDRLAASASAGAAGGATADAARRRRRLAPPAAAASR